MFAGSEAVRRGASQAIGVKARKRLDSLKQELSQVLPGHQVGSQILPPEVNASGVELSYDDAITFYLAYLTDLAVSELNERHGISRYVRRRFTLPCWESEHRSRAAQLLSRRLACAQVLADSFHNRWKEGIPAIEVKRSIQTILSRVDGLTYLLDLNLEVPKHLAARWGGLLEPLAAGSSRIWLDRSARDLVLVIDVGAGTTDLSLFWVVQTSGQKGHRAFPVEPSGTAIRMAGDLLDSVLVRMILDRAHLGADTMLQQRVSSALFLSGVRRLKEQLINTGELTHRLVNDQVVSITRKEFLETEGVRNFTASLQKTIEAFLSSIDLSWQDPLSKIRLVLTGGGCDLPMVRAIAERDWLIGGQTIRFQQTKNLPQLISERFDEDFCREYPQLAVALGGALPMVLDEGNAQKVWFGGAPAPGPLPRYPVTGT
jgi:molecular chaperone HscA